MASSILKGRVLNFTYILIGLTILSLIMDLTSHDSLSFIINALMLGLMIYFVKGVKTNKVGYMKPYKIFLVIYSMFLVLGLIIYICTLVGFSAIGLTSLTSSDFKNDNNSGLQIIIYIAVSAFYVVYACFVLYYIRLVEKYYNQVKEEKKNLEQNKNLEANAN